MNYDILDVKITRWHDDYGQYFGDKIAKIRNKLSQGKEEEPQQNEKHLENQFPPLQNFSENSAEELSKIITEGN